MKKILLLLLICLLATGQCPWANAQSPVSCAAVEPANMISNFAGWNWEVPRTDPTYCRTWAIRRVNQQQGIAYGAPWEFAQNGVLYRIALDQDYTRQKGWELLRMNLGGLSPVALPYVYLYNKYTGVIRTYFWLDNSNGTYNSGAVITMSHSTVNSQKTAVMSLSKDLIVAPDKYLQNAATGDELISYVAKMSSQTGWIVGEFNTAYDPNLSDSRFFANALQFDVYGIVNNGIELDGTLNFKTDAQEGYAISGEKANIVSNDPSDPTRLKKFLATGKKVLGKVNTEDASKFFTNINTKALKIADNTKVPMTARRTAYQVGNAARSSGGLLKTVKNVLNVAGGVSSAFGIIGNVVGFLWPDKDRDQEATVPQAPSFTPTVSNGSIALKGSITTRYPLFGGVVQLPGTAHGVDRSTQPYYNCPMGIFNIKNTPVLNRISYQKYAGFIYEYDPCGSQDQAGGCIPTVYHHNYSADFDSYQVSTDLIASYNKAAGLKLVSAQAALVGETNDSVAIFKESFNRPRSTSPNNITQEESFYNYMRDQFDAGILEVTRVGVPNQPTTFQTPFVDFGCFKNLTITVPRGTKVYIRVKVILQREDAPSSPPVFYVQDYAVDVNTANVVPTNPNFGIGYYEHPFTNLPAPLETSPSDTLLLPITWPTAPSTVQAKTSIRVPNGLIINHPSAGSITTYLAGNYIYLAEGFSVVAGTNFVAAASLLAPLNCGPTLIESNNGSCYNPNAYRIGSEIDQLPAGEPTAAWVAYPNPTTGKVDIQTTGLDLTGAAIAVFDAYGREVKRMPAVTVGEQALTIDLRGQLPGIYIIRVVTAQRTFSQKVVLQ